MNAGEVTEQQALQKAQQFMQGKQFEHRNLRRAASTAGNAYYVFNAEDNGGFVIVAGDRVKDILGYSERGNFDLAKAPSNVRWWLGQYEKAISSLGKETHRAISRRAETVKDAISPFITTTWGQFSPYNDQCPEINGEHCVTGCVATAMAQVINYTKWPESATGEIASYTTKTNQIAVPKLEATTFDWGNMTDTDIARLMRYCGQAVKMDYGLGESGSYDANIPGALIGKFGYDNNIRIVYRNGYNSETWENMIYNELKAGRPIIYGGQSGNSGHSFICHGYMDGMYYINWGWDGMFDGYFALTALNPDGNGAYGKDQTAIIGIQKSTGGDIVSTPKVTVTKITLASDETITRNSNSDNFTGIKVECALQNSFTEAKTVQSGFALYQGTELKSVIGYSSVEFSPGIAISPSSTFALGAGLTDGTYRIVPVYRESESAEWIAAEGSNYRYVEAVISGNTLTLKVMPDAAHDERLKFNPISTTEVEVRATNTDIEGDIVIPEAVTIDGKLYKVVAIANHGFSYCTKMTSIKMPSSMLYWFLGAFQGCSQLKSLTIPKSLRLNTNNGMWTMEYCISGCENLTELLVEEGNTDFCVENGALLSAKKDLLIAYLGGLKTKEYSFPESVEGITMGAFSGQKYLEVVNWSSKINGIPIDAFIDCSSLKRVNNIDHISIIQDQAFWGAGFEELKLPSKLQQIGIRSFTGCKNLRTLEIPQTLNKIGDYAFSDCSQLESITVRMGSPVRIDKTVFSEDIYQNATLYVPIGRAKYFRQDQTWGNFKNIKEIDMPDVIISDNPFDNIDENQMLFGYYRSDAYEEISGYGGNAAGTYKACISFSIGSSREKMDIYTQKVENVDVGWNVVTLESPYTITGDSIFIGIEYTAGTNVFPIGFLQYDISRSNRPEVESGSALMYGPYGENNEYMWSEENECWAMQCILESENLPLYDIHITSIKYNDDYIPYYFKAGDGKRLQFTLWLKNWGKNFIGDNFHIKAEIDNQQIEGDYYGEALEGPYAYYKVYSFNLPTTLPAGIHTLKLSIDEINGEKPLFPDDDSRTYKLRVYSEGLKRQKILMENITSTWCHDALNTNKQQDLILEKNDDIALVNLHCSDVLTSKASEEYFKRYNGVIGLILDANRWYSASTESLVYLTEDNLVAPQYDELNSTYIANYVHKGILQASASTLWGDDIVWNGDHYKMKYTIRLENEWNIDNMHIIAFIEEDLGDGTRGKPVINCNEMLVKDAEKVKFLLEPIDHTKETTFSQQMNETADLSNTVIDNTYFNMDATNGDGYDATEQALVLNSTTSSTQMSAVQGAQVGDAAVRENFSGIIFELPAGQGVITVDAKTIGTGAWNG